MENKPKIIAETPRLILREMIDADAAGMFGMDSNPKVLKYLGTPLLTEVSQSLAVIQRIQKEYKEKGVGRVAVVLKETNEFLGWAGLKYATEPIYPKTEAYHDLGYRFLEKHWGKGYATEAAKATRDYAFNTLKLDKVGACAEKEHVVSVHILQKIGMQIVDEFDYKGKALYWFEATKQIIGKTIL